MTAALHTWPCTLETLLGLQPWFARMLTLPSWSMLPWRKTCKTRRLGHARPSQGHPTHAIRRVNRRKVVCRRDLRRAEREGMGDLKERIGGECLAQVGTAAIKHEVRKRRRCVDASVSANSSVLDVPHVPLTSFWRFSVVPGLGSPRSALHCWTRS